MINCLISEPVLIYCRMKVKMLYCQLVILREYFSGIGYRRFYLIRGYWRLQDFALMQLMRSLFCAAISVRFGTEPGVSDVTHGNTRRDPYDNVRTLVGRSHSWLNWVDEDDDEDEVGLKEKPEDTRYIKKITSK